MTSQFLFLANRGFAAPTRWNEAFPHGEELPEAELHRRLLASPPAAFTVWLGTADPAWPEHLQALIRLQPGVRVVVLSSVPEPAQGLQALDAGARGYTHAYAVPEVLKEVALVVEHGGLWVGPEILQRLVASTTAALARRPMPTADAGSQGGDAPRAPSAAQIAWNTLSAREMQVARAVSAGRSNREVAVLMFISERTVKAHLSAVFDKLNVRDRLQLALHVAAQGDAGGSPGPETST